MTFDKFKETIKRATGSKKHVDSLLSNESYDTCLRVCRRYGSEPTKVLAYITIWAETTEGFDFWNDIYIELLYGGK